VQRNLVPVNAVCSFCKRIRPWPTVLIDAGYRIAGIEQSLLVPPAPLVKPDVITLSQKSNCAVLWECKSGANLDLEQRDRYTKFLQHAKPEDVQRVAGISFPHPDTGFIEVAYCLLEEGIERVLTISVQQKALPVVSLGRTTKLVAGGFRDPLLDEVFRRGFPTPPVEQVPWLIVADADTSDAELARYLLPTLVSLIPRQAARASIRGILAATLLDWEAISLDLRRHLENKAIRVLKDVCGAEFAKHFRFCKREERRHEETIEIVSDVMGLEPSAQTRALQKLRDYCEKAVQRLEEGLQYVPQPEAESDRQLPLFQGERRR